MTHDIDDRLSFAGVAALHQRFDSISYAQRAWGLAICVTLDGNQDINREGVNGDTSATEVSPAPGVPPRPGWLVVGVAVDPLFVPSLLNGMQATTRSARTIMVESRRRTFMDVYFRIDLSPPQLLYRTRSTSRLSLSVCLAPNTMITAL
jgi:hypothetical protein